MRITLANLDTILFDLVPGDRVFLRGNLGAGKTTLAQRLIRRHLGDPSLPITSPTYTYFQKYGDNIYHFDLYRVQNSEDMIRIGADEILADDSTICIIEWPEILGSTVQPTIIVDISVNGDGREISMTKCQDSKIDRAKSGSSMI